MTFNKNIFVIRQDDEDDMIRANDLLSASGEGDNKRPSLWLENLETKRFLEELELVAGIPATKTIRGRGITGTWLSVKAAYAYAELSYRLKMF